MKTKVAIYDTHDKAINALKTLKKNNFSMKNVSLLGQAEVIDNHIHIKSIKDVKDAPVFLGIGAGTTIGLLSGIGVLTIPGFGFLYGAGVVIGAIAGFDLGLITGGIVTILVTLGIKEDNVAKFHEHLKQGRFAVIINGSLDEIEKAEHILHTEGTHLELF